MRTSLLLVLLSLVLAGEVTGMGPLMLGANDAHAIIGRPLTPVSYAGVARRTTRRTAYAYGAGAGYGAAAGVAVGAAAAATVYSLPAGCVAGGGIYTCGAVRYRPYYSGGTVVYQVI
jgi:hypothetical protein